MRAVLAFLVSLAVLPAITHAQLLGPISGPTTHFPYSATEETEHSQTLADGTHISSKSERHLYLDSYGRSRTEISLPAGASAIGSWVVRIYDPLVGKSYLLDSRQKIATVMDARPPIRPPIPPGTQFSVAQPPQDTRPEVQHEDLGTQTIEGFVATGTRTTVTVPIGAQGNDRPLVTVREVWISAELRMPVYTRNSDPRNGETITRIVGIDRSEPDPALFQVPPDYALREPNQ